MTPVAGAAAKARAPPQVRPIHPLIVPEIGYTVFTVVCKKVISMNENHLLEKNVAPTEQNIDHSILTGIFEIGDEMMQRALCDQLLADFRRMENGLEGAEPVVVAKIAHELKGLAATIGAQRLADLAQTLNKAAESVSPSALAVLTFPVRQEIEGVLSVLDTCATAFRQQ